MEENSKEVDMDWLLNGQSKDMQVDQPTKTENVDPNGRSGNQDCTTATKCDGGQQGSARALDTIELLERDGSGGALVKNEGDEVQQAENKQNGTEVDQNKDKVVMVGGSDQTPSEGKSGQTTAGEEDRATQKVAVVDMDALLYGDKAVKEPCDNKEGVGEVQENGGNDKPQVNIDELLFGSGDGNGNSSGQQQQNEQQEEQKIKQEDDGQQVDGDDQTKQEDGNESKEGDVKEEEKEEEMDEETKEKLRIQAITQLTKDNEHDQQDQQPEEQLTDEQLLSQFFSDIRDADRTNEVNRILWAFKLNPLEQLNMRFDTDYKKEAQRQFRRLSLLVHPDKCKHEHAKAAFEVLQQAVEYLHDEERVAYLEKIMEQARNQLRKERRKATKHDNVIKISAILNEDGIEGVQKEWESSTAFHEKWKMKVRETLARNAFRKRKIEQRMITEKERVEEKQIQEVKEWKQKKKEKAEWDKHRQTRVDSWRQFEKQKVDSVAQGKPIGGLKLPAKNNRDEEKRYVHRPTQENFRGYQKKSKTKPQSKK